MTAYEAFEHYSQLESRCEELERRMASLTDISRFDNVAISAGEAARLIGIDRKSVIDYAKRGLLKRHPASKDEKIMLVASDVLSKTKEGLRRDKRNLKWHLKTDRYDNDGMLAPPGR